MRPALTIHGLEQWVQSGATWRAVDVSSERAVVELCTCYGEPVDTLESDQTDVIEFVRSRRAD